MNRLTMKIRDDFYTAPNIGSTDDLKYKLGKLEDLEEQLGCPLEVVVKALMYGYYCWSDEKGCLVVYSGQLVHTRPDNEYHLCADPSFYSGRGYVRVKDYKKTWWLKEDKSE